MTQERRPYPLLLALMLLLLSALIFGVIERSAEAQGKGAGEDDRFIPSEKLSADSAISFPVDI